MRLRSLLYVPADNERFIAKAHLRGADAIILDLEDAVKPERRDMARDALPASIRQAKAGGAQVFVRINADAENLLPDARAATAAGADALYVPKASRALLDGLDAALDGDIGFFALVEDPAAVLDAPAIAGHPRVRGLAVGGEDLATALGATPDAETLRLPKLLVHYAAKAHDKLSLGLFGTVADFTDIAAIEALAAEARRHGFDGASCVHPSVVPVLNRVFAPTPSELDWAERVLALAETERAGAFVLDGRMIDAPAIARARALLAASGP